MKKPKCKPASTLKSVSGLGLSKRAERYVEKNYFSMDQLVWHVRFLYYMMQYHPETLKAYRPKVFTEIISALNTAVIFELILSPIPLASNILSAYYSAISANRSFWNVFYRNFVRNPIVFV